MKELLKRIGHAAADINQGHGGGGRGGGGPG